MLGTEIHKPVSQAQVNREGCARNGWCKNDAKWIMQTMLHCGKSEDTWCFWLVGIDTGWMGLDGWMGVFSREGRVSHSILSTNELQLGCLRWTVLAAELALMEGPTCLTASWTEWAVLCMGSVIFTMDLMNNRETQWMIQTSWEYWGRNKNLYSSTKIV